MNLPMQSATEKKTGSRSLKASVTAITIAIVGIVGFSANILSIRDFFQKLFGSAISLRNVSMIFTRDSHPTSLGNYATIRFVLIREGNAQTPLTCSGEGYDGYSHFYSAGNASFFPGKGDESGGLTLQGFDLNSVPDPNGFSFRLNCGDAGTTPWALAKVTMKCN